MQVSCSLFSFNTGCPRCNSLLLDVKWLAFVFWLMLDLDGDSCLQSCYCCWATALARMKNCYFCLNSKSICFWQKDAAYFVVVVQCMSLTFRFKMITCSFYLHKGQFFRTVQHKQVVHDFTKLYFTFYRYKLTVWCMES